MKDQRRKVLSDARIELDIAISRTYEVMRVLRGDAEHSRELIRAVEDALDELRAVRRSIDEKVGPP